jgi:hypothetical protein
MSTQFFIRRGSQVTGPMTSKALKALAASGGIAPDDEISNDKTTWTAACKVRGLVLDLKTGGQPSLHPGSDKPFDVFVSHSNHNKLDADAVCGKLEAAGVRCWIAPRDIPEFLLGLSCRPQFRPVRRTSAAGSGGPQGACRWTQ